MRSTDRLNLTLPDLLALRRAALLALSFARNKTEEAHFDHLVRELAAAISEHVVKEDP